MDKNDYCDEDVGKLSDTDAGMEVLASLAFTIISFLSLYLYITLTTQGAYMSTCNCKPCMKRNNDSDKNDIGYRIVTVVMGLLMFKLFACFFFALANVSL